MAIAACARAAVLAEVLWRQLAGALAGEQLVQALGLLTAITGAGKDATARTYVALATGDRNDEQPADKPAAPRDRAARRARHGRLVRRP